MKFNLKSSIKVNINKVLKYFIPVSILLILAVGIVSTTFATTLTVPNDFLTRGPWNVLLAKVEAAKDPVTLNWRGNGGYNEIAFAVADRLAALQKVKPIKIIVIGPSISMHASVLCRVQNVHRIQGGVMIFHPTYIKPFGTRKFYVYPTMADFNPCVSKGYITNSDIRIMYYESKRIMVYPNGSKTYLPDWK